MVHPQHAEHRSPPYRWFTDGFKTGVQVRSHTYKRELEPVLKPCLIRVRSSQVSCAISIGARAEACRRPFGPDGWTPAVAAAMLTRGLLFARREGRCGFRFRAARHHRES